MISKTLRQHMVMVRERERHGKTWKKQFKKRVKCYVLYMRISFVGSMAFLNNMLKPLINRKRFLSWGKKYYIYICQPDQVN